MSSTETNESSTPFNPPVPGGEQLSKKQRIRNQRRRKRLRKRDRIHIAEVAENQKKEELQQHEELSAYKQALESAPERLESLYNEHQSNHTLTDLKQPVRAYFVATLLHFYGWIDELPPRPPEVINASSLLIDFPEHHQILWDFRLSAQTLWGHVQRNQ